MILNSVELESNWIPSDFSPLWAGAIDGEMLPPSEGGGGGSAVFPSVYVIEYAVLIVVWFPWQ